MSPRHVAGNRHRALAHRAPLVAARARPSESSPTACSASEVPSGTVLIREGEPGDRFFVLLTGVAAVSQSGLGERRVLRAGEYFGEVALAMGVPRTATVTAMTSCVVASCDEETFDELVRPLFADGD